MNRMQVQLTDRQVEMLRELAANQGVSIAELVRQGVNLLIARGRVVAPDELRRRALEASGRFRSAEGDLVARHDEYFAEAAEA